MRSLRPVWVFAIVALLCGCGGGGGGSSPSVPAPAATTPAPIATPTLPPSSSATASSGGGTAALAAVTGGVSGSVTFLAASSGSGTLALGLAATDAGAMLASSARLPKSIGGSLDPLAYVTISVTAPVTFAVFPTFAFAVPASMTLPPGASYYLAYNPGNAPGNWSTLSGPATADKLIAGQWDFATATGPVTFVPNTTYAFAFFATAQVLTIATPSPSPSPTAHATATASASPSPTPTASSVANAAFTCPTTQTASLARSSGTATSMHRVRHGGQTATSDTTMLAVTYSRAIANGSAVHVADRERALNATFVRSYDYERQGQTLRVLAVPSSLAAQTRAALQLEPGVVSVGVTGSRRFASRVTTPFYTNDPYFMGFPPNQEVLPYAEAATNPGQWDMHAIGLEHAFGYSQSGNGSGITNVNALGSSGIKIAIIDTGEDATHPELSSQIAYQHCYITSLDGRTQSTGTFATDHDGHGTDVSGIAAASPNNAIGFVGAGGKASIYGYRVFPTPDDTCEGNGDAQCGADTADIAAAINDAVAQHVNVISMSLGGGGCNGGVDTDPTEQTAVTAALNAGVIVVAASGNDGAGSLDAPACISGVIAVGATSLADGTTTGTTGHYTSSLAASATSGSPVEYVASYSQYGNTTPNVHSASAWGIVAPGGDPSNADGGNTLDYLHWVYNIWTSTPLDASFAGNCTVDFGSGAVSDCRTLIAGTSMATPHVAGAIALILAVNGSYGTPAAMKTLLCQTADDISDTHQGCGRLNVYRALATALGDGTLP